MQRPELPEDPFRLTPPTAFEPAASRRIELMPGMSMTGTSMTARESRTGASTSATIHADLWWVPDRRHRSGAPTIDRPAFANNPAKRILAEELLWDDGRHGLTPNRHPFDARHLLLWSLEARREPDAPMLELAFELAARCGGAVLGNSIGAAASIARAHLHLLGSRQGFLPALPTEPWTPPPSARDAAGEGVCWRRASAPFPSLLVAVDGSIAARARAVAALLLDRATSAFNLIDQDGRSWLFPRSAAEAPAPHFPQALGSAEIWGRWCYQDRDAFDSATADDLFRALRVAGKSPC